MTEKKSNFVQEQVEALPGKNQKCRIFGYYINKKMRSIMVRNHYLMFSDFPAPV